LRLDQGFDAGTIVAGGELVPGDGTAVLTLRLVAIANAPALKSLHRS
jgi:hypothetical protein